jgi:coiled-coil domain-containing protein 64
MFQINSQLLEAIQQKVELSQQLEQWKIDMQELLEEQVKNDNSI